MSRAAGSFPGVNPYFFHPEHRTLPNVVAVKVPGLQAPVYATRSMAKQLQSFLDDDDVEAALRMVDWLGGMEFQPKPQ